MDTNAAILVVNDSQPMRDYIKKSLRHRGYHDPIEAVDGKDALDKLMEYNVDLILTRVQMPKVSGIDLIKALSGHSALKHIPCMVLTSDTSDHGFQQAMEAGAVDFIKKPFTSSELDLKIKAVGQTE